MPGITDTYISKVNQAYMAALVPWKNPHLLYSGMAPGVVFRSKVVLTDASNTGWKALWEGKLTFSSWSNKESRLHINCLEMLAVCQALQTYLADLRGHHVLDRSDSDITVTSYINYQSQSM